MKLIDKDALVAEIERRKNICKEVVWDLRTQENKDYYQGKSEAYKETLDFLDTLEVKEVNFDADYIEEIYSHIDSIKETADRMTSGNFMHHRAAIKFSANTISKVLELIGLKAQKGEEV